MSCIKPWLEQNLGCVSLHFASEVLGWFNVFHVFFLSSLRNKGRKLQFSELSEVVQVKLFLFQKGFVAEMKCAAQGEVTKPLPSITLSPSSCCSTSCSAKQLSAHSLLVGNAG